jgi:phosphoenolpyruvate-protein phosphotransferase/dihydroxyacetone kinase phosphotransfer subunit
MVSIVIVSHSAKLAEGVRDLAAQMVQGRVPLAVAGGTDDPANPMGTDATKVQAAIESVYSPDGVLVLMDLGSALLSAEMALEFFSPEQRGHIYVCAAPLVEGCVAAAVQASLGADIHQVLKEAQGALTAKMSQLEPAPGQDAPLSVPALPVRDGQTLQLTVRNRMGLHARPAANFVTTAGQYQAKIWVSKGLNQASAKSINQITTLGVRQGDQIVITAVGPDAEAALAALQSLADRNFGAPDDAPMPPEPTPSTLLRAASPGELEGIPASPGIALGPVFLYQSQLPEITVQKVTDAATEWSRLAAAIAATRQDIEALQSEAARQMTTNQAAIFEVHALFLQDPALLEHAKERIFSRQLNAEAAWQAAFEAIADDYRALDDEYLRARAADVLDVGERVLRHLLQVEPPALDLDRPSILVATVLTPSQTARLDPANVLGICTELGGATSHSAILARGLGIPAIVGLHGATTYLPNGQIVAMDGTTGRVWPHPDAAKLSELRAQRDQWRHEQRRIKLAGQKPAVTQDGQLIEVVANIAGPNDAHTALEYGADGVGLFRTELLFIDRKSPPTEKEQLAAYRRVATNMGQRPLVVRTLDVGGDKPLPYLDVVPETNPFLGWRGIRFCLDHPEIFKAQLRAILRASPGRNLKLMFPMVSTLSELRAAKRVLADVREELQAANIDFDKDMEVGVMIEVPAGVAVADQLAAEVDFFSIGSNDLTQYVMAADRGNDRVSALANALQPAVLRLIQQTVEAAHAAGIRAGLCGELAGNPLATPLLVGLGLDELSMSAPNIPAVKSAIRHLTLAQAREVAAGALALESAEAVQDYLEYASKQS